MEVLEGEPEGKLLSRSCPSDERYLLAAARVAVIGLDCASPALLLDRWLDKLPNLGELCSNGLYGKLRSTVPPITVPAWACMVTGKDPGRLGIYGFRNRKDYSYDRLFVANSLHVREKRLWDILGDAGMRSILLGVPLTYPAQPVNGLMVGCFLAPEKNVDFTYPRWLRARIDAWAGGEYLPDVKDFRTDEKDRLLADIRKMSAARFELALRLLDESWDFFMMVEMGLDRLYHGFWRYCDPGHRLHDPGHPYVKAVLDYHIELDGHLGRLMKKIPDDTLVMVVSDHGARTMKGGFAINEWLRREGLLVLKSEEATGKLQPEMVDWSRTTVWGDGGYYARLFFNVAGREPQGLLPPDDYRSFRSSLKERIQAIRDPEGRIMGNQVFLPEEIYTEVNGIAPDLIVLLGGLDYRSIGGIGLPGIFTQVNDTGPDDANHDMHGMFVAALKGRKLTAPRCGRKIPEALIYDVAPTILNSLGLAVPVDMIGRPLDPYGAIHE